mgnify:CR=1 FL=1
MANPFVQALCLKGKRNIFGPNGLWACISPDLNLSKGFTISSTGLAIKRKIKLFFDCWLKRQKGFKAIYEKCFKSLLQIIQVTA